MILSDRQHAWDSSFFVCRGNINWRNDFDKQISQYKISEVFLKKEISKEIWKRSCSFSNEMSWGRFLLTLDWISYRNLFIFSQCTCITNCSTMWCKGKNVKLFIWCTFYGTCQNYKVLFIAISCYMSIGHQNQLFYWFDVIM